MDFGDLILLLILLAPLLRRLFGKDQKKAPRPKREPADERIASSRAAADDPLAEALRQIREAMAEPEPESASSTASPRPFPDRPRPLAPPPAREPEFHGLGAFEHDEHGFGQSNPISEEVFEHRRAVPAPRKSTAPLKQKALKKVDLSTPIEVKPVGASERPDYARMLDDHTRLREAFVLKEILDPPRSVRSKR